MVKAAAQAVFLRRTQNLRCRGRCLHRPAGPCGDRRAAGTVKTVPYEPRQTLYGMGTGVQIVCRGGARPSRKPCLGRRVPGRAMALPYEPRLPRRPIICAGRKIHAVGADARIGPRGLAATATPPERSRPFPTNGFYARYKYGPRGQIFAPGLFGPLVKGGWLRRKAQTGGLLCGKMLFPEACAGWGIACR